MTAAPLPLSDEQRSALERMARSTSLAVRQVTQAKALLWANEGIANEEIARRCGVDADTVLRWRRRFADTGVEGVGPIAAGRGRKSWLPEGTVAEVVRVTLEETPTTRRRKQPLLAASLHQRRWCSIRFRPSTTTVHQRLVAHRSTSS